MFAKLLIAAIALPALLVSADPTPNIPGPGDSYKEGGNCMIVWDTDSTGKWTDMQIELMTGDNYNMIPLKLITTIDATKQSQYTYPCPNVSPNSAIYFYQFTSSSTTTKLWTTRFTISDPQGNTTPPPQTTQSNGDNIPWGNGTLLDNGSSSASSPSGLSSPSGSSSTPSGSTGISSTPSSSTGSPAPSQTGGNSSSSQSNSNGDIVVAVPKALVFVAGLATASVAFFL